MICRALLHWWDREQLWMNITNIPLLSKDLVLHLHFRVNLIIYLHNNCISNWAIIMIVWYYKWTCDRLVMWVNDKYVCYCVMTMCWWLCLYDTTHAMCCTVNLFKHILTSFDCCCDCAPLAYRRSNARVDAWY